jgi:hypothetical protein
MSYEPENHLANLEAFLQAFQLMKENGWTYDGYVQYDPYAELDTIQSANWKWGHKFTQEDKTYWLNYTSVQCILDTYQPNRVS